MVMYKIISKCFPSSISNFSPQHSEHTLSFSFLVLLLVPLCLQMKHNITKTHDMLDTAIHKIVLFFRENYNSPFQTTIQFVMSLKLLVFAIYSTNLPRNLQHPSPLRFFFSLNFNWKVTRAFYVTQNHKNTIKYSKNKIKNSHDRRRSPPSKILSLGKQHLSLLTITLFAISPQSTIEVAMSSFRAQNDKNTLNFFESIIIEFWEWNGGQH